MYSLLQLIDNLEEQSYALDIKHVSSFTYQFYNINMNKQKQKMDHLVIYRLFLNIQN